ncbi:MAG: suppressor of fused domain protein [Myxococcota bacterium]
MSNENYPVDAPGWAALDRVGQTIYPGQTPHQFTSQTGYDLESPNPLPAICVWEGRDPAHWHYVTYGLTELFEKSSPDPKISGFGFEVTLRVPREEHEDRPPEWPLGLLQGVGHYALSGQGGLDSGHIIDLGGPMVVPVEGGPPSLLTGVVMVPDPHFGKVDTQFGSVLFLQLFGLTADEVSSMQAWPIQRKVGLVTDVDPLGITRIDRAPFQQDRRTAAAFRRHALGILIE